MSTEDYWFENSSYNGQKYQVCYPDTIVNKNKCTLEYNNGNTYTINLKKYSGPQKIKIQFRDGEVAEYDNAYDLQDFLNQVNHYHDLEKDFQTVADKLLEVKPELEEWVKKNFSQYLKKDN